MKILYLIDTLEVGGSEKSLLNILGHFRRVHPIMCHLYPGETLKPSYEAAGISVISLNVSGKYGFPTAIRQVLQLIRTEQPDLIHTTLFRADIVGRIAGRLAHIPVLSSFVSESYHPDRWSCLSLSSSIKFQGVYLMDRLTASWAHHFLAVSEATRSSNCQALYLPLEKVSIIYRGRDPKSFLNVSEEEISKLRLALGLTEDALVLLNVARLLERKGQEELIRALPLISHKFPAVHLLMAGEGLYRSKLEALIRELNLTSTVHLLSTRQDIPQLLHLANVFVFPSHVEGHPGSLIEAMFAGRPVVASDIPVHRESIVERKTGILVPVRDPEAIAQGVIQMLQDLVRAQEMGKCAQQVALERFHINQVASQHEELYEAVLQDWKTH
jgi:glycosyltransferase involved in cell wall biosynthesis